MTLMPNRTPPPGRSSNVFTVRETPSTAIDPLGARNGASSAPASISTPCESPSGATAAILPTPSTWPVTMWPPSSSPTFSARSRSEEHTSELQSLMRISYAVFCLKKKKKQKKYVRQYTQYKDHTTTPVVQNTQS